MRTSKFSEEQIIGFLRQVEGGMPVKELGRRHRFSDMANRIRLFTAEGLSIRKRKKAKRIGVPEPLQRSCSTKRGAWPL